MSNLSVLTIMSAAAVDSINPCAIGVLVFLITFLASLKKSRRSLLFIGLTYILVVYICYFGAGIGLIKILSSIPYIHTIYRVLGLLIIGAGVLDIIDAFTKNPKPLLAIPAKSSPKIKKYIYKASVPAAIILGAMVSLFELPCTGGVYIAITSLISKQGLNWYNFKLMALYNFIFVLPLLVLLLLSSFGLSSEKIDTWRKGNKFGMRLVVGLGMVVLGVLMVFNVI